MKYTNIEVEGVHEWDYPNFCDAAITYAEDENGVPLTGLQIDKLNEDSELVYAEVLKRLF